MRENLRALFWSLGALYVLGLGITGCSYKPDIKESPAKISTRDAYIEQAQESLEKYQDRVDDVSKEVRPQMNASLRDGWTELRLLKNADEGHWRTYRERLDGVLNHLNEIYQQAKKD